MRVALFLNQFDPITANDKQNLTLIAKQLRIDHFVLMPLAANHNYPLKNHQRIKLCQLGVSDTNQTRYLVSDFAINQPTNYPPFTALEYLSHHYHQPDLFLVVDYQQLLALENYFRTGETKILAQIVCLITEKEQKQSYSFLAGQKILYYWISPPPKPREQLIHQLTSSDLVPAVLTYINHHGLYAEERLTKMLNGDQTRINHCWQVGYTAVQIAKHYLTYQTNQEDEKVIINKAYLAGIYHDVAKKIAYPQQINLAKKKLQIVNWPHVKVLHGPIGAFWIKNYYQITDPDVLQAIAEHTVPQNENTNLLSKIIFLADRLEPAKIAKIGTKLFHYSWKLIRQGKIEQCFAQWFYFYQKQYPPKEGYWYPTKF